MNLKEKIVFEMLQNTHSKENRYQCVHEKYCKYIDIFISLTNKIGEARIELPDYKSYLDILLFNFIVTSRSLLTILEGVPINTGYHGKSKLTDIVLLHTTSRYLIENYLTIYYLFVQEKDDENLIEFRYKVYKHSGLCKWQEFPSPDNKEIIEGIRKQKEDIKSLRNEIETNPVFSDLNKTQRRKILPSFERQYSASAKIFNWIELFEASKLSNSFEESWKWYSNYAHSEFISLRQLKNAIKNTTEVKFEADMVIPLEVARQRYNVVYLQVQLVCHLILDICELFECAKKAYENLDEKTKIEIQIWNFLAENMDLNKE